MSQEDFAEVVDTRTEEGAARAAELAEKTRKKRRSESKMIADGIREIATRFEAFATEQASSSVDAAIDRGEVVSIAECERREKAAAAEARTAMRKFLNENTGAEK